MIILDEPSRRKLDVHHKFHHETASKGEEITMKAKNLLAKNLHEDARQVLFLLCDHWKMTTLEHAKEEENGWYQELADDEEVWPMMLGFRRDHYLLERFMTDLEAKLIEGESLVEVIMYADGFLKLLHYHNELEEKFLAQMEEETC